MSTEGTGGYVYRYRIMSEWKLSDATNSISIYPKFLQLFKILLHPTGNLPGCTSSIHRFGYFLPPTPHEYYDRTVRVCLPILFALWNFLKERFQKLLF